MSYRDDTRDCLVPGSIRQQLTWSDVDNVVAHELQTYECNMRLQTTKRRQFAFVAIYSFLYKFLTTRHELDSDEWCPKSTARCLSGLSSLLEVFERRVQHYEAESDRLTVIRIRERHSELGADIVASRHTETSNPDNKIWSKCYSLGVEPHKVVAAYEKVKHLLPGEAITEHELRKGPVFSNLLPCQNIYGDCDHTKTSNVEALSSREFYDAYVRSDIMVAKSNKLSETFSEHFEVLPGTCIKVPRRLERYFNVEIGNSVKHGGRFPSNYIRAMLFAYSASEIFGAAFSGTQVFLKGFSDAAARACGEDVSESSFSKLKAILRTHKLFVPGVKTDAVIIFPRVMQSIEPEGNTREFLAKVSKYSPDRKDKVIVALMRSPVAEHEVSDHMAIWLALMISKAIGRQVSPHYALLLLVNWAASEQQKRPSMTNKIEENLKRLTVAMGLTFNKEFGVITPVIGFGSGLTRTRTRQYAAHIIRNFIQPLIQEGQHHGPDIKKHNEDSTLESMVSDFFINNDIIKDKEVVGVDGLDIEQKAVDSMVGQEFIPCEARRRIHEEEYTQALMTNLRVKFRFGVCGFQHPLTACSNRQTLVTTQLLKQRLIYLQKETAAALNFDRLIQFLLPHQSSPSLEDDISPGPWAAFARERLTGLSRVFIETISKVLRTSIACERVLDDISIKFNSDMFPLGKGVDSVLRTKAGLVIGEHARQVLSEVHHFAGQFEDCQLIASTHVSDIGRRSKLERSALELAHGCIIARDMSYEYNNNGPFLPPPSEIFEPSPMHGIENPVFPVERTYSDNTALRCNEPDSAFWLQETNETLVDGLISKGILSIPHMVRNNNWSTISENDHCIHILKNLREINMSEVASDKPRKSDPTPWSSKNTGQSGRSTTEFSPNSIIVITTEQSGKSMGDADYVEGLIMDMNGDMFSVGGENDVFLAVVETQRTMAQNDISYPEYQHPRTLSGGTFQMMRAPDISPIYRHGGKTAVITLKHSTCNRSSK
nr:wsv192-like protein [Chionoecetes opilio bacilliform virus]